MGRPEEECSSQSSNDVTDPKAARQDSNDLYKVADVSASDTQRLYVASNRTGDAFVFVQEYPIEQMTIADREGLITQSRLQYPHILQIRKITAFKLEDKLYARVIYEFAQKGTLLGQLQQQGGKLQEHVAKWYFQQLALAVDYCHMKGIIIGDIKLANIILDHQDIVKVTNFQNSQDLSSETVIDQQVRPSTLQYVPPEQFQYTSLQKPSDVWALGVALFAMLTGDYPFNSDSQSPEEREKLIMKKITGSDYPRKRLTENNISAECIDLIDKLLDKDQSSRCSAREVLKHPWVSSNTKVDFAQFNDNYNLDHTLLVNAERNIKAVNMLMQLKYQQDENQYLVPHLSQKFSRMNIITNCQQQTDFQSSDLQLSQL